HRPKSDRDGTVLASIPTPARARTQRIFFSENRHVGDHLPAEVAAVPASHAPVHNSLFAQVADFAASLKTSVTRSASCSRGSCGRSCLRRRRRREAVI